ncbi:MAG: T9SS type A sorting domain-containing protein [Bacteroidetes bacterium]|nr:T9SS type A sorting domain-containing protein [Bacteroidota bacterium]
MGHILNHTYPFYASDWYVPYAEVMYKRDNILPASSWNDTERNYYHNLTNSNGDSLVDLNERLLAFNTANFTDGFYRIFVEVFDEAGNSATDSMDVKFVNGNVVSVDDDNSFPNEFSLSQNYPNPFNPSTKIKFTIAKSPLPGEDGRGGLVTLKVYDVLGNEVATLVNEEKPVGSYEVEFDATTLPSGIYFYKLQAGSFVETKKMVLMK